jgi:anti-sigma-K factor RskA
MANEQHPFEYLPGYVLGVLDPQEMRAIERHVSRCAICQAEAESFRQSLIDPAFAPDPRTPRTHVKKKLMDRIFGTQDHQAPQQLAKPSKRRLNLISRPSLGMMAASFAIVVFIAMLVLTPRNNSLALASDPVLRDRQVALTEQRIVANPDLVDILQAPGTLAHDLEPEVYAPDAKAALFTHQGDPRIVLLIRNLPEAPHGHIYQLWLAEQGQAIPIETFHVRPDGTAEVIFRAPEPIDSYQAFMVTVEPTDGTQTPSEMLVWELDF